MRTRSSLRAPAGRGGASATGTAGRAFGGSAAGLASALASLAPPALPATAPGRQRRARRRASSRGRRRRCPAPSRCRHRSARPPSSRSASPAAWRNCGHQGFAGGLPVAVRCRWCGRGSGRRGLVDDAQHLADLDVLAFLAVDPAQHTPPAAPTSGSILSVSARREDHRQRRPPLPCAATWRRGHRRSIHRLRTTMFVAVFDHPVATVGRFGANQPSKPSKLLPRGTTSPRCW